MREMLTEMDGVEYVNVAGMLLMALEVINSKSHPKEAKRRSKAVIDNFLKVSEKYGHTNSKKIFDRGVIDEFTKEEAFRIADSLTIEDITMAFNASGFPVDTSLLKKGKFK